MNGFGVGFGMWIRTMVGDLSRKVIVYSDSPLKILQNIMHQAKLIRMNLKV